MRAAPSTLEIVEAWALQDPRRPALREGGAEVSYGQFAGMLLQAGRHLQELGVTRGQRVAVSGPGFGIQMLMLLACEALGAVTLSFQGEGDSDAEFVFSQVDWVLSARPQPLPAGVRFLLLDAALVQRLAAPFAGVPPQWSPCELEEPQRISRTSGSSGASKFMVLRRRAQECWVRTPLDATGYTRDTRLLLLGPLVINAVFGRSSGCLRLGGMLLAGEGGEIERLAPTHVFGLPLQLERLLAQLPAGYVAPRPVAVVTAGGVVPPALRERAQSVFGCRIVNRYGGNEVHAICDDLDESGSGWLVPGVDVRILDADGRELAAGEEGVIALRTPAMADGYLARPQETAAAFREGWFVSGDVGALVGRRRLRLTGRHDDLVNIGGIKWPAARLEQDLRLQPAIADVAALAVNLQDGAVTLGVAVVVSPGATREEAQGQLQQALRVGPETLVRVVFVPEIPRLHTGKTDRMALLRALR